MKVAITGSSSLVEYSLDKYLSTDVDEIISFGGEGIDECAKKYAMAYKVKYTELIPRYDIYGDEAVIVRNKQVADYADYSLVFWDGKSAGTKLFVDMFKKSGKPIFIIRRK